MRVSMPVIFAILFIGVAMDLDIVMASSLLFGPAAGIGLLAAWVIGLIVANSALAALAALGLLEAERNFTLYATVAVVVAVLSIAMGLLLLAGGL